MGRLLNLLQVQNTLEEEGIRLFTPKEFARLLKTTEISARKFLERYTKKGAFVRAKRGLYLYGYQPSQEFVLANKIYEPSYISLETALSYYGIIPEAVYTITSVTSRASQEFTVAGRLFRYQKIKQAAFTGYVPCRFGGQTGLIATPEKALVDYLYFVSLGKKSLNDRLRLTELKFATVKKYSQFFTHKGLRRKVNDLAKRT